jgi:hypothetical protein
MMFTRKTLAGEFIVVNRALVRAGGAGWNERVGGYHHERGVRPGLDEDLVPGRTDTSDGVGPQAEGSSGSRNRAPYVCQSQSTNLFMSAPTRGKVQAAFVLWVESRTEDSSLPRIHQPAARAQRFTIAPKAHVAQVAEETEDHSVLCARREGQHVGLRSIAWSQRLIFEGHDIERNFFLKSLSV